MRRADRLFQIIQILQRSRTVTTAHDIAEELEVSPRTIYRDIKDLMMNRVPIRGEAGTGYVLEQGYDLPPLMFNEEEIDAVMLGVHWVYANGDPDIRRAARDVFRKIEAVVPKERRDLLQSVRHIVPEPVDTMEIKISMPQIREAIRKRQKIRADYVSLSGDRSTRTLCPMIVVFFQNIQLLVAWCELRNDYRNFRVDCFEQIETLPETFSRQNFENLEAYLRAQRENGMT